MERRLTKSVNRNIAGVCAGLAEYMNIDPTLVRLGYAFITIFTGFIPGIIFYFVMAMIIPNN